jgi:hypothetical protein
LDSGFEDYTIIPLIKTKTSNSDFIKKNKGWLVLEVDQERDNYFVVTTKTISEMKNW